MSDDLNQQFIAAIVERLEALGWEVEHYYDGYPTGDIEVSRPDPDTGHAMRFSGWWISWRIVDGELGYGVGDDTMGHRWRQKIEADTRSPMAVADAADRVMHMLWHTEERDLRADLYAKVERANRIVERVQALAHRVLVTPGQIRDALKPGKEQP